MAAHSVLREAALARHGIVLQASVILADDLAVGRLVQVLPDYEASSRPLHIVYATSRQPTPTLRGFIDHVVARLGTDGLRG